MPVRPSGLLIFGDPTAGTGPMQPEQTIGVDLPLKVLVWEDASGGVWISYDAPAWLAVRQGSTTARRTLSTPSAVLFPPSMAPLPLSARPRDWFFVVVFAAFALTSFLVDTLPALGWSTFMHDALVASYADCDPMFMRPPAFLLVAATVSGFVWGPLYCWFVWGFVRGRAVIRVPALLYAGALTLAMLMIFAEELGSPVPGWASPRPRQFAAYNLPYLGVPMFPGLRMWRPSPFGGPSPG